MKNNQGLTALGLSTGSNAQSKDAGCAALLRSRTLQINEQLYLEHRRLRLSLVVDNLNSSEDTMLKEAQQLDAQLKTAPDEDKGEVETVQAVVTSQMQMRQRLGNETLYLFYRHLNIRLEELYLAIKVLSTHMVAPKVETTALSKAAKGFSLASGLFNFVPLVGSTFASVADGVSAGLQKLNDEQVLNMVKHVSSLATASELTTDAECFARRVTLRFRDQLESLRSLEEELHALEEAKQVSSHTERIMANLRGQAAASSAALLKKSVLAPVHELADYVVALLLDEAILEHGYLTSKSVLSDQLLRCLCMRREVSFMDRVRNLLGCNTIVTRDNRIWRMEEVFRCTGYLLGAGGVGGDTYYCVVGDERYRVYGFCRVDSKEEMHDYVHGNANAVRALNPLEVSSLNFHSSGQLILHGPVTLDSLAAENRELRRRMDEMQLLVAQLQQAVLQLQGGHK